jgi:hypothetical protein
VVAAPFPVPNRWWAKVPNEDFHGIDFAIAAAGKNGLPCADNEALAVRNCIVAPRKGMTIVNFRKDKNALKDTDLSEIAKARNVCITMCEPNNVNNSERVARVFFPDGAYVCKFTNSNGAPVMSDVKKLDQVPGNLVPGNTITNAENPALYTRLDIASKQQNTVVMCRPDSSTLLLGLYGTGPNSVVAPVGTPGVTPAAAGVSPQTQTNNGPIPRRGYRVIVMDGDQYYCRLVRGMAYIMPVDPDHGDISGRFNLRRRRNRDIRKMVMAAWRGTEAGTGDGQSYDATKNIGNGTAANPVPTATPTTGTPAAVNAASATPSPIVRITPGTSNSASKTITPAAGAGKQAVGTNPSSASSTPGAIKPPVILGASNLKAPGGQPH